MPTSAAASERPRVLIVEDEPAIARCLASFLTRNKCEPVIAPDGTRAMSLLALQRWDVVVVDQLLGRGPRGDEVLAAGLASDPQLPTRTIFMTGDITLDTHERIMASGVHAVLAKPFPLMKLLDLVREILERSDKARKTNGEGRRQA